MAPSMKLQVSVPRTSVRTAMVQIYTTSTASFQCRRSWKIRKTMAALMFLCGRWEEIFAHRDVRREGLAYTLMARRSTGRGYEILGSLHGNSCCAGQKMNA